MVSFTQSHFLDSSRAQAEALFLDGNRCAELGDVKAAEACFRQSLNIVPGLAEAHANLGLLYERCEAVAKAEACYRQAIDILPDCTQIYLNLGVLLVKLKRFAEAERIYRQALVLEPNLPAAWSNFGVLLACIKRESEAEHCYRRALKLNDRYSKAQFNLSYLLLRQGRFEEGWRFLEARDRHDRLANHFSFPRWHGENLSGKAVVIGFERGHGDMIQFCRYASILKTMGTTRIAVVCHPGLKILFNTLSGVDEVFSFDDEIPTSGWDFWTPPMSLPYYCQTRLDNIPTHIPYLAADPAKVMKWSRLLSFSGLRVGLVWKGNPHYENDGDRSLPSLDLLAPLSALPGVKFVSLQKGNGEDEAQQPPEGLSLLPLGGNLEDFSDTAAVIENLDLVISVDTAVAHLAGALGKRCWVLLPDYRTDWRWLTERTDSPWYPNQMRLFRQPPGGDWVPVITAVVEALRVWKEAEYKL